MVVRGEMRGVVVQGRNLSGRQEHEVRLGTRFRWRLRCGVGVGGDGVGTEGGAVLGGGCGLFRSSGSV